MRVKILADYGLFKKGTTVYMNAPRAKQLIKLGVAVMTKDMNQNDMRLK